MEILLTVLSGISSIVCLVCWVIVLINMFKESVVQGILGIFCGLWAFIKGWMSKDEYGVGKVMLIWTLAMIAGFILNMITIGMAAGQASQQL